MSDITGGPRIPRELEDLQPLDSARAAAFSRRLLDDPAFKEAYRRVEERITTRWKNELRGPEEREKLHTELQGLRQVVLTLTDMENQGPEDD